MRKFSILAILWSAPVVAFLWTSLLILAALLAPALYAGSGYGPAMTTAQYDHKRTGWNQNEETLTIDTVSPDTFGKLWTANLTGQIYGAPLYVGGVTIAGDLHNVVYVATQANFIYALDADTGEQLWMNSSLGLPGLQDLLGPPCRGNIGPNVGITSTPVIDLNTGTLYAVGLTRQGTTHTFKMVAVDIATGQGRWVVPIQPAATPPIDTRYSSQRGALALSGGLVYAGFGGIFGDCGPYHGWVVAVDTNNPMGQQLFYRTPGTTTHRGSGIWAGGGLAVDDETGYIFASTGNSFSAPGVDLSNAVLRLAPDLTFSGQTTDYFMPSNWRVLNSADADLGSSAPLLLPPQKGSNTQNMIFITGKAGVGHLLNRDNLGGVAAGDGVSREGVYSARIFSAAYSTAAYYEDPDNGPTIALSGFGTQPVCGIEYGLATFSLQVDEAGNSTYDPRPLWCTRSIGKPMSPLVTGVPGTTGIVWVVSINPNGTLYAHNAATGDELYNSNMVAGDALGNTEHTTNQRGNQHFTVIDGKVFIPAEPSRIVAYGMRNQEGAK